MSGNNLIPLGDVDLSVHVQGRGPLLFAVSSGWGVGNGYLTRGLAQLAEHFTLACVATRGSGASTRPTDAKAMSTVDMGHDLERLREQLNLPSLDVFGHSNGGAIALSFAADHPASCRRLLLADSQLIGFPGREATQAILDARSDDPRFAGAVKIFRTAQPVFEDQAFTSWLSSFFELYFYAPERHMRATLDTFDLPIKAWAAEQQWAADAQPSATQVDRLGAVTADTLIMVGEADFITPVPVAERIHAGIAGSELVVFDQCGHIAWMDAADRFFSTIKRFMLRDDGSSSL